MKYFFIVAWVWSEKLINRFDDFWKFCFVDIHDNCVRIDEWFCACAINNNFVWENSSCDWIQSVRKSKIRVSSWANQSIKEHRQTFRVYRLDTKHRFFHDSFANWFHSSKWNFVRMSRDTFYNHRSFCWRRELVRKWIHRISRNEFRVVLKWIAFVFDIDVARHYRSWIVNLTCESKHLFWRFKFSIETEWWCWISRRFLLNEFDEKLVSSTSWKFLDFCNRWESWLIHQCFQVRDVSASNSE